MALAPASRERRLRASDGFRVECPRGPVGVVEEVWLGEEDEPRALAVRTIDGRHGLLLVESVSAVLPEERQLVVDEPELLELGAPRLEKGRDGKGSELVASWATTGVLLPLPEHPAGRLRLLLGSGHAPPSAEERMTTPERPLWQAVAILYASIAFIAASLIGLVFLLAWLLVGHAY
jgi:hypothetical protein